MVVAKVLVTGATGHLGANLVRVLTDQGEDVRVLLRAGSNNAAVERLDVERCYGDIRDAEAMRRAVRGCRRVHHCAAKISTVRGGERDIFECNVIGTRNVLDAARAEGVARVVVTGSLSAVGHLPGRPVDETVPFYPFDRHLPYSRTKMQVEHEVLRAAADGLDVVVATSCAIIGPNDYKPSRLGELLVRYARGRLNAYVDGGFEFVTACDIAAGHVLTMRLGRPGQKYIFGSGYASMDELMAMFQRVTGRRRPPVRLPASVMMGAAQVLSPVLIRLFPRGQQLVTPAAVRLLAMRRRADSTRARVELGFRPSPIEDAVRAAYEDFVRRGIITVPGRSRGVTGRGGGR
jgi:nucleoside-diphosphate-sugar epimerase